MLACYRRREGKYHPRRIAKWKRIHNSDESLNTPICAHQSPQNWLRSVIYFFRRATSRTRRVCEIAPGVSASLRISAASCWCRLAEPEAGLALSGRPT